MRRRLAIAGALLLMAGVVCGQSRGKKKSPRAAGKPAAAWVNNGRSGMSVDISEVRLPDEAFWATGADRGRDPLVREYKLTHFGVLIDAPREVSLAARKTFPLFAYYLGKTSQVATRSFGDHGLLVVMDPDRNELHLADAEQDDGDREPVEGAPGGTGALEGWLANISEIDLRERIPALWRAGRVISQVVLLDLPSNRVETKLMAGASAFVDVEKEKFLAAERAKRNPARPFPKLPAAAYEKAAGSPALPEGAGIALQADRVVVAEKNSQILLRGAFRLPVAPEEIVKAENAEFNRENGLNGYAACLTIHLVAVSTASRSPLQYRLQIPVRELNEGVAAGYFTIDLAQLPDFPISEQTVFLYPYAKEVSAEPVTIGIIDRRPAE